MAYRVDFKKLAEEIDIGSVAQLLKLTVVKERTACPVCDSDRAIQLYPETNSFRCHAAGQSGDCIALYAHVMGTGMYKAALALQEQFQRGGTVHTSPDREQCPTAPQKTEGRTAKSQPASTTERLFDPDAYLAKLAYTEEVAQLGIAEADAQRLGIGSVSTGLHRGRIVFAIRNPDGSIAGFVGVAGSDLKVPQKWILPADEKVVPLRRA